MEARAPSDEWLLTRWRRDRDRAARDQLIERLLPLARRVARGYGHEHHVDDLVQAASLGLFKAVDRYDPARGTSLHAYAMPMMTGEVRRWLRDNSWAVRPPRALQELALEVRKVADGLEQRLGRAATVSEIAGAMNLPIEDVLDARLAGRAQAGVSLERETGDDEERPALHETLGEHDPRLADLADRTSIETALAELSPRDRMIIRLRYEQDLTQIAIGERLGMSQMTVSRALRRVLPRLRASTLAREGERAA